MWIKTINDGVINLDHIVEIKVVYHKTENYTVVTAVAVNDWAHFLWKHEGEAVEMANEWIDMNILKMRGEYDVDKNHR